MVDKLAMFVNNCVGTVTVSGHQHFIIGFFSYQNTNHNQATNSAKSQLGSMIRTVVFGVGFSTSQMKALQSIPFACARAASESVVYATGETYTLFSALGPKFWLPENWTDDCNGAQSKMKLLCSESSWIGERMRLSCSGHAQQVFVLESELLPVAFTVG